MSNKTTLQTNNTIISNNNLTIDDILDKINNLPEAGSGSTANKEYVKVEFDLEANMGVFAFVDPSSLIGEEDNGIFTMMNPMRMTADQFSDARIETLVEKGSYMYFSPDRYCTSSTLINAVLSGDLEEVINNNYKGIVIKVNGAGSITWETSE